MTEKTPKVSVIIPTYNRAHLMGRAIRSLLSHAHHNDIIRIKGQK